MRKAASALMSASGAVLVAASGAASGLYLGARRSERHCLASRSYGSICGGSRTVWSGRMEGA